ncbi:MAG: DUF4886 domain-containing protein [Fluviicola sp.]|jgi:hypothetical protein|nr:DUF4886 domain-containing protein [Fluviicola sp.]
MKKYWKISLLLVIVIIPVVIYLKPIDKEKIKILFIGNSLTYRNNMPTIFEGIAISKGKKVYVEDCTKGKATIFGHSHRNAVKRAIKSQDWDYVIIQGSSRDFIRDSKIIQNKTLPALERIIAMIQKNNPYTKMLFYMTWGYRDGYKPNKEANTFLKMANKISNQYLNLYKTYDIGVVPVGMAWKDSRKRRGDVKLYVKDGGHPSLKGSYLAASCFYAAIFNESPVGSNYYGKLGPKICYYLQSVAERNVMFHRKKYGLEGVDEIQKKKL